MERHIFLTGFPGFLGSKVVETLFNEKALSWRGDTLSVTALVQPEFYQQARERVAALPDKAGKAVTLVRGDLSAPRLGLNEEEYAGVCGRVNEVMHIAALYRLDVPEDLAYQVNVVGTQRMLDFAADVRRLRVFSHISSIIVSGRRTGVILEDELHHDRGFHNHYEATKYLSEVLIRNRRDTLPVAVFRPGVVVGDSRTGDIPKYDGPYYTIKSYLKLRFLPKILVPAFGHYRYSPFNMAPVDYVAEALVCLSAKEAAIGKTFHLTDPYPLTTGDLFGLIHDRILGPGRKIALPKPLVRLLGRMPVGVGRLLGFARGGAVYLDHTAIYDTRNADTLLKGTGIRCPAVHEYIDAMIDYVKRHPDIPLSI
jgi:thioester reductase-like protein